MRNRILLLACLTFIAPPYAFPQVVCEKVDKEKPRRPEEVPFLFDEAYESYRDGAFEQAIPLFESFVDPEKQTSDRAKNAIKDESLRPFFCEGGLAKVSGSGQLVPYLPSYYLAIARCHVKDCETCLASPVRKFEADELLEICPEGDPVWVNWIEAENENSCDHRCPNEKHRCVQCEL